MNKFDLVSKRDTSLDLAKGIGIILVVIGHCLNTKSIPGIIIYSFHMPLFFVISGLLFNINKNGHFIPFLFKKTRTLIVPAFFFTCIAIVVDYFFYGTTEMLHNLLWKGLPVPLWFLLDLFLVEILYWPLSKYNGKHNHLEIAIIAIFLLIGIISSKYNFYNPYSLCTVFTAVSFYAIGAWSQDYFFQLNIKINLQSVGIMLVLSIGYIVLLFSGGGGLNMYENKISLTSIPVALMGIICTLFGCKFISNKKRNVVVKVLAWLGRNSIIVMGMHCVFIRISSDLFKDVFNSYFIYKCFEQLFVWTGVFLCVMLIVRYTPWIIGKKVSK